jgi:hypothetical protein
LFWLVFYSSLFQVINKVLAYILFLPFTIQPFFIFKHIFGLAACSTDVLEKHRRKPEYLTHINQTGFEIFWQSQK